MPQIWEVPYDRLKMWMQIKQEKTHAQLGYCIVSLKQNKKKCEI
jgi:hypothetical protein